MAEEEPEDSAQEAAKGTGFCPHCGGEVDESGRSAGLKAPPYQLSKFSPQDRGYGDLYKGAVHAAGDITNAARQVAAGD